MWVREDGDWNGPGNNDKVIKALMMAILKMAKFALCFEGKGG